MTDPRFNDIACKLRRIAADLDARAERTAATRRAQCLAVLDALAGGDALPKAATKAGVSNATARRLRDKWRDLGTL